MSAIEMIVDNDHGPVVPAEADSPVPASVMVNGPAPGFEGDPVPADHGIPNPAPVEVRAPVDVDRIGDPDVSVWSFIDPGAAPVELFLVLAEIGRQIARIAPLRKKIIPRPVPLAEFVESLQRADRLPEELAVNRRDLLLCPDEERTSLSSRLHGPLEDRELGLPLWSDVDPAESFFKDIERGVGGMEFDLFFVLEHTHSQVDAPFEDVEFDRVVTFDGQQGEFDLSELADPKEVPAAEMGFRLASLGADLVSRDKGQVDLSLFITQIGGPLDKNIAADIVQAGVAVRVIAFGVLGRASDRDKEESEDCESCFFHRLSPFHAFLRSNKRAIFPNLDGDPRCPPNRTLSVKLSLRGSFPFLFS